MCRAVRVLEGRGRPDYVRLVDIPLASQTEYRAALRGSACPGIEGEVACAWASDWDDWLDW
jgi:hypothetical protein